MKKRKLIIIALLLFAGISLLAFGQDLKDIQKGVASFSEDLSKSLPFNSSLGLNWSDAYIGKLFPSAPPHFGVGGSFGFTTMELPAARKLAGYLGYKIPFDTNKMFLPAYTAEARIGGLFLPFDIGVKFGYLPPIGLWGTDMNMNYLLVGGDIRYALLDGTILPKISLGVGLDYLSGSVGGKVGNQQKISYGGNSITLEKPDVNLKWDTLSLDLKLQISKSFLIITPYLGLGGSYAWSEAGYSVDAKVTNSSGLTLTQADIDMVNAYLNSQGLDGMDVNHTGISSMVKNSAFGFRAFGGFSINLVVLKLDLTGLYSFLDKNYGGSFGVRFQL